MQSHKNVLLAEDKNFKQQSPFLKCSPKAELTMGLIEVSGRERTLTCAYNRWNQYPNVRIPEVSKIIFTVLLIQSCD
jgi:hypothetical protein